MPWSTPLSSVMPEILVKTLNGEIFFEDLNSYFQNKKNEVSQANSWTLDPADEDSLDNIKLIVNEFIGTISWREDRPFIHDEQSQSITEGWLVKILCHIFESEISLFDEKKSHYEKQSIIKQILSDSFVFSQGITSLGYIGDPWIQSALTNFSKYKEFIVQKSQTSYSEAIWNRFNTCAYYQPYIDLLELDQNLDPKSRDNVGIKKRDYKNKVKDYYTKYGFWVDLINWNWNIISLLPQAKFTDIYLYFWYLKNHEYDEEEHLKAYQEMIWTFERFTKTHWPDGTNKINDRIIKTNTIFLLNYIISSLASAFIKDESLEKKSYDEVERLKSKIEDLVMKNQDEEEHSYFTYYKLSRLYLWIGRFYLKKKQFEKAKKYSELSKEKLKESKIRFNLPWWSLLRFYPDKELLLKSKIFSLSGFCRMHWNDFNARFFALEFDIMKFLTDIAYFESIWKIEKSEKRAEDAEKNATKHNVEILSIFAAIVMFVSGNIQIFQYISSAKLAIIFMVWFAFSLASFVFLIRFNFRIKINDDDSTWSKILYHLLNITILLASLIIVFFIWKYIYSTDDSELKNEGYIDNIKSEIRKDIEMGKIFSSSGDKIDNTINNYIPILSWTTDAR